MRFHGVMMQLSKVTRSNPVRNMSMYAAHLSKLCHFLEHFHLGIGQHAIVVHCHIPREPQSIHSEYIQASSTQAARLPGWTTMFNFFLSHIDIKKSYVQWVLVYRDCDSFILMCIC